MGPCHPVGSVPPSGRACSSEIDDVPCSGRAIQHAPGCAIRTERAPASMMLNSNSASLDWLRPSIGTSSLHGVSTLLLRPSIGYATQQFRRRGSISSDRRRVFFGREGEREGVGPAPPRNCAAQHTVTNCRRPGTSVSWRPPRRQHSIANGRPPGTDILGSADLQRPRVEETR